MVKDVLKNCGLSSFRAYMLVNIITFLSNLISHIMNLSSGSVKESSNFKGKIVVEDDSYSCTGAIATVKKIFIALFG